MAPILDWKKLMKVDPDALPHQEERADRLLETVSKVDGKDLKTETLEHLIHLFKITQSLLKMKAQEVELALEEVEKAGEEQAKCENQFKTKVMKLQNELEMAQRSAGGRDTRFLRDEIRQLEKQLEQKERQLTDTEKELEKEKKVNEQLALRNEDAENENIKLRRENEQLRQDLVDYQKQIDSQKETILLRREEDSDYRSQLSKKNFELVQYLDEIQNLTEANEELDIQNQEMRKNLEESVQEMEKMTDEYNKMKLIVQQSDIVMDQLRKEKEQYKFQIQELSDQLKAKNEEDDPLMAAVNAKVEEWKKILASKDDELLEYQQTLFNLKEKMKMAQLDVDRNSILALQQGVQERDAQIKLLTEQVEQYTKEMEQNAFVIEELKNDLQKDKGHSSLAQQNHIGDMQEKLKMLEERTKEAEKSAELAEADAREKDKELVETLKRMRDYELGIYGLEEAVAEIKDLKKQIKIRDHEIETLIQEVNKLELKISDFLDENEELRERLGLEPKTMIDLNEFRNSKALKQQQYRVENQILLQEIERLEEERLELKKQVRKLAQEKGRRVAMIGLDAGDVQITDGFTEEKGMNKRKLSFLNRHDIAEVKAKNEYLENELSVRERDLENNRTVIAKFQSKLKELSEENKQLEQGMKEILQAVKEMQKDPNVKAGETALIIPSLDRLVNAMELKNSEGTFDASVHLKAQVDQLTGRNEELRQVLKQTQKEATDFSNQLTNANEKIAQLKNEICLLRQSEGANIVFQAVNLPEGMVPSSVNVINSLNEYLIHLIQELENKEQLLKQLEDAVEDYKRKFAVVRHQQGLLYKEYQSQKERWQKESEDMKEEMKKLEEQKEQDATKVKAYSNLLSALQLDPDETKKVLAENSRKITVLRVNERSLTRQYTTLLEMERHLRKENEKLKDEITHMETAVVGKIGNLQRFKETASFKIAALQKVLDSSVPLSELELANKQYNALTAKYRDVLQKDNLLVQRTTNMEHMEHENESLKAQINLLNKELEITKEKLHTVEQAWEQMTKLEDDNAMDKATKAITNNEILSISKKITMLEMKELNERQRAEHLQRMYEHLRNTVKQIEERNFELETKFAELTKINLEAQKVEQELRDELSKSVSKAVSDADRRQIMDLEKREMELKTEVSKLRELSDVAKMQVEALEARQQYRDQEVEFLRMQILDYQAQSDEKVVIAKLHQQIIALQGSESVALGKLETLKLKLQKVEIHNLRLDQKLDDREQALYFARLEGRNRAKHLQQTVQSLRRQFSGALPLAQQEKFSKTMIQLQNDKLKILEEVQHAQQERRNAENRALEVELKLKSLEELLHALKDTRGAQKVIERHMKMEELRLQELKLNRELVKHKEEVKYLRNVISEYEHTISNLEEEIVQQNKFHEERQMAWDQREVELQRQLDLYDHQQNEILGTAVKLEEATGSVPDPTLPLPQQLELALRKIQEHIRTILETRATCKSLEEKLKEKETAVWKAEQNVLSREKVINELRLRLPTASETEKIMAKIGKQEDDPEYHHAIKIAHQTIANMQARLNQKEEVLKKYQHLLAKAREEQEETAKKHEEDLRVLHQKLNVHTDNSLNKFRQTALELGKKTSLSVSDSKRFLCLAEMEQTVAEQDNSLASLVGKLKKTSSDLEKQKQITLMKIKEFETIRAQLQEKHTVDVDQLKDEVNELRNMLSRKEKALANVEAELEVQKEANSRAPTATMKNLLEQLKSQLAIKEKQQKALSKALLELRAEMTAHAEQQIISAASQREADMNVQEIVDRQTKELTTQIEELNNQITKLTDNLKISKTRESSLSHERDELNQELQGKKKAFAKMLREKNETEKENEELKKRIRKLSSIIQSKADEENLIDALQKKNKKLENELEKCEETEKKSVREDKTSKEEIIRWEEGKKWQIRMEGLRNKLREKEKEADALAKQLNTLKEIYTKTEKEKIVLQKKLKTTGVTVDRVVGVRASETEKELEELRKRNLELENEVAYMRTQQAMPRDYAVEELHFKNQYLQEKLHALQKQCSRHTYSRPLSTCDQTELTKSVPISIGKQKFLNSLQKKFISNRDEIKHQTNHSITDGSGIDEEADVQTSIMHKEGHDATADASTEVSPEQHPEDSEKCKDTDISREGLKNKSIAEADEENCSEKEENTTQTENGKLNEEFEEEERKQEILKQSNVDEEEGVEEHDTDRMSCNQSDSGQPSNQANGYETEKINVNNEMNQPTAEDKYETYRSCTEGVETTPEFCEMPETSGIGSDDQYRREQEVFKENLRLSSENIELRFQLEQANKDLPRLKDQVGDLKEMCELLKKEKEAVEQKLGSVRGAGRSGKTVPELEKTIGLMKKVVERVQRENEDLKKAPAVVSNEKLLDLEQENERLKSEMEKMKLHLRGELSMHYESKAKGMEKVITENERLRKELKKEADSGEKLRIAKNNLEILNEKLTVQLEETIKRLNLAESQFGRADSKSWKSVVTRMHETKVKEMEMEIGKKPQSIPDLKQLLQEATEHEHDADKNLEDVKEQIELLKHLPEGERTEQSFVRELQLLRLTTSQLEKEKAELAHQVEDYKHLLHTYTSESPAAGHNEIGEKDKIGKLRTEVADLQTQLKASELEKQQLKEETKKLRRELENCDPSFFEEIEDLKYNYNEEVKKNIILEERLKQLSEEFGIQVDSPGKVSVD
ncbi:centrosomal protein of 290 kDa isoform X1 [Falco cherrug]|uniref:centrosomal protein of 290 kDa isoform X1 n=1 Tax=Falco cherrug TaxID=345164 RepID=UPI002479F00D|nr:centrosomal protein of 290 kDa isoform X1 [Falco cherrug]XP_055567761.1 centrosomal protein of 290 kDa isoform X1 [Falco cherrug]XP_055567762.1 centrosomal protein of 290 kDa isoform X1 [Falco cherrug]XP_055567763.1 centrosomal protein of 290 kDa isoform X1 [Falco cherrug]XP_055567764.1 centrosomal protein of 290 kDa isoform X1 [Falco cherrug]